MREAARAFPPWGIGVNLRIFFSQLILGAKKEFTIQNFPSFFKEGWPEDSLPDIYIT
jgi:hypothetical protein